MGEHAIGLVEISVMSLELDITQAGTIAIWNKEVDLFVKLDLNLAAYGSCIVIMGNKEECQILGVNGSIIEGGEKIL
jgi:hypothetical protein